MDKQDIIRMAREAGMEQDGENFFSPGHEEIDVHITDLERFFHMAQAAAVEQERKEFAVHAIDIARKAIEEEREAIAAMFDEPMRLVPFVQNHQGGCMICGFTPSQAAKAIRARGETK
jgi:hypothetical protein